MRSAHKKKIPSPAISSGSNVPIFLIILAFFVGIATHLAISVIFADSKSEGVIHACVDRRKGDVRIIHDYKDYRDGKRQKERQERREDANGCRESEVAMQWNIQGPPGPQGPGGGGGLSFPLICVECSLGDRIIGDSLTGKDLRNAILVNSEFFKANLSQVNFSNARLQNVAFTEANLSQVNLENANLKGAQMDGANIEAVNWKNTICPDNTNSNDANNSCVGHLTPVEE